MFLFNIWLVGFQIAPEFRVNLDFSGVLLAFGVDTADQNLVSNPLNSHYVSCEQGTRFIDTTRCIETDSEQSAIAWCNQSLSK